MNVRSITLPTLLAATLACAATSVAQGYPQQQPNYPQQQQNYPQQQQPGYQQQGPGYQQGPGGWDAPPRDFHSEFQHQGFRDGLGAARQDFEAHRAPNASQRPELRRPPVPRAARNDYRDGFRRGYDVAVHHMMERREGDRRDGYAPPRPY